MAPTELQVIWVSVLFYSMRERQLVQSFLVYYRVELAVRVGFV